MIWPHFPFFWLSMVMDTRVERWSIGFERVCGDFMASYKEFEVLEPESLCAPGIFPIKCIFSNPKDKEKSDKGKFACCFLAAISYCMWGGVDMIGDNYRNCILLFCTGMPQFGVQLQHGSWLLLLALTCHLPCPKTTFLLTHQVKPGWPGITQLYLSPECMD